MIMNLKLYTIFLFTFIFWPLFFAFVLTNNVKVDSISYRIEGYFSYVLNKNTLRSTSLLDSLEKSIREAEIAVEDSFKKIQSIFETDKQSDHQTSFLKLDLFVKEKYDSFFSFIDPYIVLEKSLKKQLDNLKNELKEFIDESVKECTQKKLCARGSKQGYRYHSNMFYIPKFKLDVSKSPIDESIQLAYEEVVNAELGLELYKLLKSIVDKKLKKKSKFKLFRKRSE